MESLLSKLMFETHTADQFQINPITHFHYSKVNELDFMWLCVCVNVFGSTFYSSASASCTFVINFNEKITFYKKKLSFTPMKRKLFQADRKNNTWSSTNHIQRKLNVITKRTRITDILFGIKCVKQNEKKFDRVFATMLI